MRTDEFQYLISRPEGETLDFKRDGYDLVNARNEFIKDILAMANTPRDEPAHIVLGVSWTPESGSTVVGLVDQQDDAVFQSALGQDRVRPNPRFMYSPFEFEGKQVGVLEVPREPTGPYTPLKDYEGLQAGAVYYRRGTQNQRAVGSELRRIFTWFQRGEVGIPQEYATNDWSQLIEALRHFETATIYMLGIDRISSRATAPIHALGIPSWRAVLDFDPNSDVSGLLNCIQGTLGHHRVIHRVVRGEYGEYKVQPEPGTHWFFARGLSGRLDSLSVGNHRDWLKAYKQELARQLERLAGAISPSPVVAVLLWSDANLRSHLRTLIEELHGAFGDSIEVVVVSSDAPSFEALAEEAGATFIQMNLRSLCSGIAVHFADLQPDSDERCVLPSSSGAPMELEAEDRLWLSEDLDLIHRSIGLSGDDDSSAFRRGGTVSWRNLHLRHDCDRDIAPKVLSEVEQGLARRQTLRLNLYHAPGAGGTTVGHRVAWDLHHRVPVCALNRCEPRETAERINKVAALTESSVLVLIDGGQHSERDIDDLYEFLSASQTPAVLLQVLRRFRRQQIGKRQFWLASKLSDAEADRFRDAYTHAVPTKQIPLRELAKQRNDSRRTAFFFGLTAFGRDFRGLSSYVDRRVKGLTEKQLRILVYIGMAHYYGQQSVPAQAFARLLGLPRSRTLDLPHAFAETADQALDLLVTSQAGEWRTAHPVVALEIMQQVLAPGGSQERQEVWRQNLSSWARDFANFCRGAEDTASDRLLELVRRVFIYRDNIEVLGTERAAQPRFAQLIEEIPLRNGKIDVLRYLCECFPLESHFHAHLGRFLGLNGEYGEAIERIEFAISLQPHDHVLHHMRGMVFRQKMRAEADASAAVDKLVLTAKEASDSFQEARSLSPDLEHGYISEVQMLIDLVDRSSRGRQDVIREVLAQPEADPYLKRALDRAEDLLDQVQQLYVGENPSRYALDCRARLQRMYGDYSSALQAWDSLLSRPEVAKPPVRRQIVWTILRKRNGTWEDLNRRETERVRRLLEENLEEEVRDSTSLRLWLRAIRHSRTPPSLDSVIETVTYWKTNTGSLDAAYYLYVLHMLGALEGSTQSAADAERALEECRAFARFRRDRTRSFEWIGHGEGVTALVHQSRLGEWKGDFWESTEALNTLEARVASIDGPQKGQVELAGGITAFFVPGKAGLHYSQHENAQITCFLGFSYDGPRAWNVRLVE